MAQRYVVENPQQEAQLRPIASPVDAMIVPEIRAPELQNIIDLSPLSKSFSTLAMSMAEGMAETTKKQAEAFYGANKEQVLDALSAEDPEAARNKLAALTRSGKIPEAYSPLFWNSTYTYAARDLLRKYSDDLSAEVDKYARVEDYQGNFLALSENADQFADKVWQDRYAKNPVFANFYGQQEVTKFRSEIEADFRSAALARREENLKQWRGNRMDEEIGTILLTLGQDFETAHGKLQETISEYRAFGVPNIQEKVAKAVLATVSSIRSNASLITDPVARSAKMDEAKDLLMAADDIAFGSSKLGDNPSYMASLDKAMEEITDTESMLERRDAGDRARALSSAGYKVIDGVDKNLPLDQFEQEVLRRIDQEYANDSEMKKEALLQFNAYKKAQLLQIQSSPELLKEIDQLIGKRRLDAAESKANDGLANGQIGIEDYQQRFSLINSAKDALQRASRDDYYTRAETSIGRSAVRNAIPSKGTDLDDEHRSDLADIEEYHRDQLFDVSKSTELTQEQKRERFTAITKEAEAKLKEKEQSFLAERAAAVAKLNDYKTAKTNLSEEELSNLMRYLPREEQASIEEMRLRYTTIPEYITNPRSGPLADFSDNMRMAGARIESMIGERVIASQTAGPIMNAVNQAFKQAALDKYRELLPLNLGEVEVSTQAAAAGNKAALAALDNLGTVDKTVTDELRNAISGPKASLQSASIVDINRRAASGQSSSQHFVSKATAFGAMFDMNEDDIHPATKNLLGQVGQQAFDASDFYESVAEVKYSIRDTSGKNLSFQRGQLTEAAADQFDNVDAFAQSTELVSQVVTEVYAQTGMTLDESLNLLGNGSIGGSQFPAVRLNAEKIDPFYTPLLMDIPLRDAMEVEVMVEDSFGNPTYRTVSQPTVSAVSAWFTEARIEGTDENAALRKLMRNFSLPYDQQSINAFENAQIKAHQQYFKP